MTDTTSSIDELQPPQTEEEISLIAKWNLGDYSAEGWVDNTTGLSEEARKGLEEYLAQKYGEVVNASDYSDFTLLVATPAAEQAETGPATLSLTLQSNVNQNAAEARIYSGRINNVQTISIIVVHPFTQGPQGFTYFRAAFERQGGIGTRRIQGNVTWVPGGVSTGGGPAAMQYDQPVQRLVLSAMVAGTPPTPRLQYTATVTFSFRNILRGIGSYGRGPPPQH